MARNGCKYQGSIILFTGACTGAHAALPRSGSSRLTLTLSLYSAACAPLSRTSYYNVIWGFTRAIGSIWAISLTH